MRITMEDGTTVERTFGPSAGIGYRAKTIEVSAADFMAMALLGANDPGLLQRTLRQLASRLPDGRIDSAILHGIRLDRTCEACPEVYDAYFGDRLVGYLRLRHGNFRVMFPDHEGDVIMTAEPKGDGIFDDDEREEHLTAAKIAIAEAIVAEVSQKPDDTPSP